MALSDIKTKYIHAREHRPTTERTGHSMRLLAQGNPDLIWRCRDSLFGSTVDWPQVHLAGTEPCYRNATFPLFLQVTAYVRSVLASIGPKADAQSLTECLSQDISERVIFSYSQIQPACSVQYVAAQITQLKTHAKAVER